MGQVARGIEEAGIPTVTIYCDIYRQWALERLKLPRVLFSRFFLGRLLGEPGRSDRQHAMIRLALSMLEGKHVGDTHVHAPWRWMRN